ncbi:MAG TPA: succinate dehydrogenase [Advenella sp.]|nr:succinate dehydrogenase [Advenella sp.]
MEMKLFLLQRLTAMIMAPFIFVHIGVIIYAVRGGLSAEEILGRTQGNGWWIAFYTVFVVSASIHAPIGIRKVLREWARLSYAVLNPLALALGLLFLALGLRAVSAVGGLAW